MVVGPGRDGSTSAPLKEPMRIGVIVPQGSVGEYDGWEAKAKP